MNNVIHFILAVTLVLGTPGPTNTLLATAGRIRGWRKSLVLVPAEVAGYTITIGILLMLVRPHAESSATATAILRGFCALYLLKVAWLLWSSDSRIHADPICFRHVFVTTLLNPKGIVFAFLIFPGPSAPVSSQLRAHAIFVIICATTCLGWLAFGMFIGKRMESFVTPQQFQHGAAIVLTLFGLVMALSIVW